MSYLDGAFVLAVTGAAWIFPPSALLVGAAFFGLTWWLNDRRKVEP